MGAPCAMRPHCGAMASSPHDARIAFEDDVKAGLADGEAFSVPSRIDGRKQKYLVWERRWVGHFASATTSQGKPVRAFIRLDDFFKGSETGANLADTVIALAESSGWCLTLRSVMMLRT